MAMKRLKTIWEPIRSFLKGSFELFISVVLVLLFFSVVLGLLNRIFPTGASIQDLMAGDPFLFRDKNGVPKNSGFPGGARKNVQMSAPEHFTAKLTVLRNEIKSKRADSIAWKPAREGMLLYHRDSVQTLKRSSAVIVFDEESYLKMGENSLIILQRLEEDPFLNEKRSLLVMAEGDLRGKIKNDGKKNVQMEVTIPSGLARIFSQEGSPTEAEFKITVNADRSSTLSVYSGSATLVGQHQEVQIEENQAATLRVNQPPSVPVGLPDPPRLLSPEKDREFFYQELPPQVEFSWSAEGNPEGFRFLLDRTPDFKSPIVDETLPRSRFVHGNLKEDRYYWKVSSVKAGREGAFSPVRPVRLKRDTSPPWLRVRFPSRTVERGTFQLTGKTEPGATVFVGERKISVSPSGEFETLLNLRGGVNVIVVEAVDPAGNIAYRSELIHALE